MDTTTKYSTETTGGTIDLKPRHWTVLMKAVERCESCGKRLAANQHELCSRCDAAAFDALPLPSKDKVFA